MHFRLEENVDSCVILHERIFNLENVYAQGTLVYWLLSGEKPQGGAGAPLLVIAAEWRDLVKQCVCAEANSVCETLERLQRLPFVQSTRPGLETRATTRPRPPSAPHTRPASAPNPPIKRGTRALSPTGEMRQEISSVSSSCYACACPTRRWQPAARRDPRVVEQLGPAGEASRAFSGAHNSRLTMLTLYERIRIDQRTWLWCLRIGVQGNVIINTYE